MSKNCAHNCKLHPLNSAPTFSLESPLPHVKEVSPSDSNVIVATASLAGHVWIVNSPVKHQVYRIHVLHAVNRKLLRYLGRSVWFVVPGCDFKIIQDNPFAPFLFSY